MISKHVPANITQLLSKLILYIYNVILGDYVIASFSVVTGGYACLSINVQLKQWSSFIAFTVMQLIGLWVCVWPKILKLQTYHSALAKLLWSVHFLCVQ